MRTSRSHPSIPLTVAFAALLIAVSPQPARGACIPGFSDAGGGICSGTFVYTGAPQTVTLPANVDRIAAVVAGAEGGTSLEEQVDPFGGAASPGGKGGRETATIPVAAGATLTVVVGQAGTGGGLAPPGFGGYGGGGHGTSRYGGNGGGGSYVFDANGPLIVAGGGGGGGYDYNPVVMGHGDQQAPGGAGSGASPASDGQSVSFCCDGTAPYKANGGGGANPSSGGLGGHPSLPPSYAFGQADGDAGYGPALDENNFGVGGSTHNGGCCYYTGWAGGGGGGYYGGGGGGNIEAQLEGGGGGGGAGFVVPAALGASSEVGVQIGDGEVTIRYASTGVLPTPTVSATPGGGPTVTATPGGPTPTTTPTATRSATPTPTATLSPTPTPTATPTPSGLDHFTCYGTAASKGAVKFAQRTGDSLVDAFGPSTVTVKPPKYLCAPTNKLGEDPTAPAHPEHLEAYAIKAADKFAARTNLLVVDQFNTSGLRLDAKKPTHLLVPTLKVPGGPTPPTPAAFTTDHFECYTAAVTPKTAKFVPVPGVTLVDQFGPMTVDVQKPKLFCAPVDKNGEDPTALQHAARLVCYQIKQVDPVKFTKRTQLFLNNQFGPTELDAKKPALLCVVATLP